jgi:hypothetical protein
MPGWGSPTLCGSASSRPRHGPAGQEGRDGSPTLCGSASSRRGGPPDSGHVQRGFTDPLRVGLIAAARPRAPGGQGRSSPTLCGSASSRRRRCFRNALTQTAGFTDPLRVGLIAAGVPGGPSAWVLSSPTLCGSASSRDRGSGMRSNRAPEFTDPLRVGLIAATAGRSTGMSSRLFTDPLRVGLIAAPAGPPPRPPGTGSPTSAGRPHRGGLQHSGDARYGLAHRPSAGRPHRGSNEPLTTSTRYERTRHRCGRRPARRGLGLMPLALSASSASKESRTASRARAPMPLTSGVPVALREAPVAPVPAVCAVSPRCITAGAFPPRFGTVASSDPSLGPDLP